MEGEIKFRAWDTEHKKFQDENYCVQIKTGKVQGLYGQMFPEMILQQFTGLKDKNGKEIYEGDIISFGRRYDYFVKYKNCAFYLYHTKQKDENDNPYRWGLLNRVLDADLKGIVQEFKVIGNIYETPELLTPTNKRKE